MTIKMPRNLMTAISVVAFAVMLNGCGGGGGSSLTTMDDTITDDTTPPTTIMGRIIPSGTTLTLPPGHGLQEGTLRAKMGETVALRDDDGNVIVSGTCNDVVCSADLTGDTVTLVGEVELVEANALVLALLTDLLPPDPADLTDLETVQAAAVIAAAEAATAAEEAKTASDAAQAARQDRAIFQTGDLIPPGKTEGKDSGVSADKAYMQAKTAADEAAVAQTASDAAAEDTDVVAATRELVKAEAARDTAVDAQGMAETHRDAAVLASTTELKIVEKTKTVGDTSIEVDEVKESKTTTAGTEYTGLIDDPAGSPLTTKGLRDVRGRLVAPVNMAGDAVTLTPARTAITPRIGVTYDSADDTARLTLIKSYLGSQTQMQFVRAEDTATNPFVRAGGEEEGPVLGADELPTTPVDGEGTGRVDDGAYTVELGKIRIDHDGDGATDDAAATESDEAMTAPKNLAPQPAGDHFVDSSVEITTTETLYYVETGKTDTSIGIDSDNDGMIADAEKDDGIDQTKLFLERDLRGGTTVYKPVAVIQVTVDNTADYTHIHYGLWNGLTGIGDNVVDDLGTGFVTAISSGTGMTDPDHAAEGGMPNSGEATYNGNWVANIQEADKQGDGTIRRHTGTSSMLANFGKDTVKVNLSGLATLAGAISENTFSGDSQPTLNNTLPGGLANTDDFMGSFSGGFFGPDAAEAGGVFDYASDGSKNGAFRGSFGGADQ